jgi:hypothetical protein
MGRKRINQGYRRRWRLRICAVAALTAGALVLTVSQAIAAPGLPGASALPHATSPALAADASCRSVPQQSGTPARCVEVRFTQPKALSPALLAAVREALTEKAQSAAESHAVGAPAQPDQASIPPSQCQFQRGVGYDQFPSRFISCSRSVGTATFFSTPPDPMFLGVFTFIDLQWTVYSGSFAGWIHGLVIIGVRGTMIARAGAPAIVSTACDSAPRVCSALNPTPEQVFIASHSSQSFLWLEFDNGPAPYTEGEVDRLDPFLGITIQFTLGAGFAGKDTGLLAGRCDSVVTKRAGCVDEHFTPTLNLPVAKYGSAAAMIAWAQEHLTAAWGAQGKGDPLTYRPMGGDNREVVCKKTGPGAFVSMKKAIGGNDGSMDSCDEYPFAATEQSAALHGVANGGVCAQVEAYYSGGPKPKGPKGLASDWQKVRPIGKYNPDAKCVRGHIPLKENTGVGNAFSSFRTGQRLIGPLCDDPARCPGDAFWVRVTGA